MTIRGPATFFDPGFRPSPQDEAARWRSHANQLEQAIQRLQEKPCNVGAVIGEDAGKLILRDGPHTVSIRPPVGIDVKKGDVVYVTGEGQILGRVLNPARFGRAREVKRLDADGGAEVAEHDGQLLYVVYNGFDLKVGDRVLLDAGESVVVHVMPGMPTELVYGESTHVTWDDIGGQDEAKRALREAIEEPRQHPELYAKYGKRPTRGVLLHGPPGTGKTLFAKAVATAMAQSRGGKAHPGGFIYVKGPEVLNKFVGASEAGVRGIFQSAREFAKRAGYPAVICIDEADALLGKRGADIVEGMEKTVVPQFLAEMDGLDDTGAIVLLLTNRPEAIDAACLRDGRVDRKVKVGRPTREESVQIVKVALASRYSRPADVLAVAAVEAVWSGKYPVAMARMRKASDLRIGLDAFVSGAMLVGIVEKATQAAICRDIAAGGVASGIGSDDILLAVQQTRRELDGQDHTNVVLEAVGRNAADIVRIEPCDA
jgi:proteasome-associated ATPase